MLCYCLGVRYGTAERAIRAGGLRKVSEVTEACKAGGGCRSCHPEIQELLDHLQRERRRGGLADWFARMLKRRRR
jgi:NifU-like protein